VIDLFVVGALASVPDMTETPASSNEQPISSASDAALPAENKYKGVRGWLLFFCITLTILAPISAFRANSETSGSLRPYFQRVPNLRELCTTLDVLNLGIALFAVIVGVMLWRTRPNAVHVAKLFLWCLLGFSVGVMFLPSLFGLPIGTVFVRPGGIGYFLVWYFYLKKSKRVKATFGSPTAP
jgi:Protein of unknown function (DUF2569)